jgi:hypothetical protein
LANVFASSFTLMTAIVWPSVFATYRMARPR